jgi:tetraacyldisaccharide-1-P 4'-kinase
VLDAGAPFGGGACPPLGDLRARPRDLVARADVVAVVGEAIAPELASLGDRRVVRVPTDLDAAIAHDGARLPLASLAGRRVGLVTGVARPDRVERALAVHAITPCARIVAPDHARFRDVAREAERLGAVEAWLTTTHCTTKLPARIGDAPVLALARRIETGDLVRALEVCLVAREAGGGRVASKTSEPLC